MKIKEKTKDAFINVFVRLIQIVVAMIIIGPFVAGVFNQKLFFIGILLSFGFAWILVLIGQSMKEG